MKRPRPAGVRAAFGLACALASGCVHPSIEPTSLGGGRAQGAALPREFSLLSWNTHKQGSPPFEAELLRFSDGVDLLLLQEATEAEPVWSLLPSDHSWTLVVAFEYSRALLATGVATGSIVTPICEQALLSSVPEPLTRTPKSSLLTWVAIEGDTKLLLVNLHGVNFRPAAALKAQLRALDEVLATHEGPLVVAGDFNTWSGPRREVVEDFAARHGLASAFDGAKPRLDDVYVRGLIIHSAEILRSRSSDHDALRVELALP